jgi:anti-sigma B factor antagonist
MTAARPSGSPDHLPYAAITQPDRHPAAELLTVAARPVPPDALVIAVAGEVDLSTTSFLQNALLGHLYDAVSQVVVDLTAVDFLGAAGLTVLVNVKQAAAAVGSSVCLVACTRVVLLPLTITGLDGEFDIYPALGDALPFPGGGPDG